MIVGQVLLGLFVLWVLALMVDANFFNGRYLIKTDQTAVELYDSLERVRKNSDIVVEEWDHDLQIWFFDFFINVPYKDESLERIRSGLAVDIEQTKCEGLLPPSLIEKVDMALRELK